MSLQTPDKIRTLQRKLYLKAKAEPNFRFYLLYDKIYRAEVWRAHTIAQPGSPGDASWNGLPLAQRNGGSAWNGGSYDPALGLVFWGTDGPTPHSQIARG